MDETKRKLEPDDVLLKVTSSLQPPSFDISLAGVTDVELQKAWELSREPFLMLSVLQALSVDECARISEVVDLAFDGSPELEVGLRLDAAAELVRALVPTLPRLSDVIYEARSRVCLYIPKTYFPREVLASTEGDPLRNFLLELAYFGWVRDQWKRSLPLLCENPLRQAWISSSFDLQLLVLRLLRPAWWNDFELELANCLTSNDVERLMISVADRLPNPDELGSSAEPFSFDPLPDLRS